MEKSDPLSQQSPIGLIRGIGDARAKALAELNIYSIQDFLEYTTTEDGILRVAGKTGMRSAVIVELRSLAEMEIQKSNKLPEKTGLNDKRMVLYGVLALLNISMVLAGIVVEATSYYHVHHPTYAVTALYRQMPPSFESNYEMQVSSTFKGTNISTRVLVSDRFDLCFGDKSLTNIPVGILFHMLGRSNFRSVTATIRVVEQRRKELGEGWVTLENAEEFTFPLTVRTEDISNLENYPGTNLLVWINSDRLDEIRSKLELLLHSECHFDFSAEFIDDIDANVFDPYRKGTVSVLPFIYYDDAKYVGMEDLPSDGLGPMLKLEPRGQSTDDGIYQAEYFWTPDVQGEFISPDDLIGARQFYDLSYFGPIETGFSYKAEGAKWLTFISGIIGLQMFFGVIQLAKMKFRR